MLNTHKGTVVRAILETGNGPVELNPLHQNVGGLVLNRETLKGILSIPDLIDSKDEGWNIVSKDGKAISSLATYSGSEELKAVKVLVVYPDGTTWEGEIGGSLKDVSLISWSDEIIRSIDDPSEVLKFYKPTWRETPTSVVVRRGGIIEPMCVRIEHQCGKQCKKI